MAKGKIKTMTIKMISTAGTGFFYVTTKNPRNVLRKLSLKKVSNKHALPPRNLLHLTAFLSDILQLILFDNLLRIFQQYDPIVRQHVIFNESKMK